MNCIRIFILVLFSVLAFSSFAANVVPSKGLSILFVNGEETESKIKPTRIQKGFNQIVVRMDMEVGRGSGNNRFTSAPYIITFNSDQNDVQVSPPKVYSITHAENIFRGVPEWKIESDGSKIAYTSVKLKGRTGTLPYAGIDDLVKEYNISQGIVFTATPVVSASTETKAASKSQKVVAKAAQDPKPKTLEQLQAWYLKASKEERKAFRKWMIDQE
ncbi:DUF2057 domain-containing protein [Vibrio nigripulchritudo]|uniref:YccT family protein n=1 Tax=Vibrio nigripulchritudo TaxID=28173 RepID=UPI0003B22D51|nr:DUF2057 domain-containing protein [Vibrio nigripulchritudo]CCN70978.1 conserved exported hypothetical protein [Vibrio nigripulchritudo SFn118]